MFGRRSTRHQTPTKATPTGGNWLAPRSGVRGQDAFPWEDDLVAVAAAEGRRERRPSPAPSVLLDWTVTLDCLVLLGPPVVESPD
jgi:hypothetical protein